MTPIKPGSAMLTAILAATLFTAAQPGIAAQPGSPAQDQSHVISMTNVQTTLEKAIDAKKSKAGDPVTAKVSASATLNDGTVVPPGSVLTGKIDSITPSANKGDSTLVFTLDKLQIKGGKELAVKATVVQVASLVPMFGAEDKPADPSSYRAGTAGNSGQNNSNNDQQAPHPIEGLIVTGNSHDAASATMTQAKKNVHLPSGALLQISVAVVPPGVTLQ